jgi:hypothetical protein
MLAMACGCALADNAIVGVVLSTAGGVVPGALLSTTATTPDPSIGAYTRKLVLGMVASGGIATPKGPKPAEEISTGEPTVAGVVFVLNTCTSAATVSVT